MKQLFFQGMLGLAAITLVLYVAWLVFQTVQTLYGDWALKRELQEIRAHVQARRQRQAFPSGPGTTPPCQHLWQPAQEGGSGWKCARCGALRGELDDRQQPTPGGAAS